MLTIRTVVPRQYAPSSRKVLLASIQCVLVDGASYHRVWDDGCHSVCHGTGKETLDWALVLKQVDWYTVSVTWGIG